MIYTPGVRNPRDATVAMTSAYAIKNDAAYSGCGAFRAVLFLYVTLVAMSMAPNIESWLDPCLNIMVGRRKFEGYRTNLQ